MRLESATMTGEVRVRVRVRVTTMTGEVRVRLVLGCFVGHSI